MLSIGSFSNAAQLSLKALRLYDQLGILKPSRVDRDTGYRYYLAAQLDTARVVRMLRQLDMPLATIRRVLEAMPDDGECLVREYWQTQEQRIVQGRIVLSDVIRMLRREDMTMTLDVDVKTVDAQPVASMTVRVTVEGLDAAIRGSLDTLYAFVESQGTTPAGAPLGIFHGPINHEADGPIEVCVPTTRLLAPTGDVTTRTLPAGMVASVTLLGADCEFPAILKAYDATFEWIHRNGYQPQAAPREIWHSSPGTDARMEIAVPFAEQQT